MLRRGTARRALLLLALLALAGCGLIIGIPDHELLEPDADAGGPYDASTMSVDGSVDGAHDAATDASLVRDASALCDGATLTSDPHNCGACGHDCLTGTCGLGVCQPQVLSVSVGTPVSLTVNDTAVYWTTTNGTVLAALKTGSNPQQLAMGGVTSGSGGIAADDDYVYYAPANNGQSFVALDGGASGNFGGYAIPVGLIARGTAVYVVFSSDQSGAAQCAQPTTTGGACTTIVQQAGNAGKSLLDMKLDDAGFVWSTTGDSTGQMWSCPPAGCLVGTAPTPLFAGGGSRMLLAINSDTVFWIDTDGGTGRIRRCERGNCQALNSIVADGQGNPSGIVVDATRVYWTDPARGRVLSCPVTGCPSGPEVIAEGGAPTAIAMDPSAIYWTDLSTANAIVRVAKP